MPRVSFEGALAPSGVATRSLRSRCAAYPLYVEGWQAPLLRHDCPFPHVSDVVGVEGFEPSTYSSQS